MNNIIVTEKFIDEHSTENMNRDTVRSHACISPPVLGYAMSRCRLFR